MERREMRAWNFGISDFETAVSGAGGRDTAHLANGLTTQKVVKILPRSILKRPRLLV